MSIVPTGTMAVGVTRAGVGGTGAGLAAGAADAGPACGVVVTAPPLTLPAVIAAGTGDDEAGDGNSSPVVLVPRVRRGSQGRPLRVPTD